MEMEMEVKKEGFEECFTFWDADWDIKFQLL